MKDEGIIVTMRKSLLSACAALLILTGSAAAKELRAPAFVPTADFDALDMLPHPPAADSVTTKKELTILHWIEDHRTPEEVAQAKADEAERDIFIFKTVLGDGFNAQALPLTALLSKHVEDDQQADSEPVKNKFDRVRPYNNDKTLHPVCALKTVADSYPSGHSMTGYLMALTLASMLPEKRDAIFARADDYLHNRLICGVHYPSDVQAGKEVAYALFGVMEDNPKFKAERAAAEAEIRKALNLPAPKGANSADHAEAK